MLTFNQLCFGDEKPIVQNAFTRERDLLNQHYSNLVEGDSTEENFQSLLDDDEYKENKSLKGSDLLDRIIKEEENFYFCNNLPSSLKSLQPKKNIVFWNDLIENENFKNIQDKFTVVLDLDETLIHSFFYSEENGWMFEHFDMLEKNRKDQFFMVNFNFQEKLCTIIVKKRNNVDYFLKELKKYGCELILFTAAKKEYATAVINQLNWNDYFSSFYFSDDCEYYEQNYSSDNNLILNSDIDNYNNESNNNLSSSFSPNSQHFISNNSNKCNYGNYNENLRVVKNLEVLNKDLNNVIIIDNSPVSYCKNIENAVPITSWYGDEDINENELMLILDFLKRRLFQNRNENQENSNYVLSIVQEYQIQYSQIINYKIL